MPSLGSRHLFCLNIVHFLVYLSIGAKGMARESGFQLVTVIPGAVAGAVSIGVGHPLDTIKTRMQANMHGAGVGQFHRRSAVQSALTIVRAEGIISLYRGVTIPLFTMTTKRAVQFSLWEHMRGLMLGPAATAKTLSRGPDGTSGNLSTVEKMWKNFVAGAFTGLSGSLVGCPAHVIKVRTQITTRDSVQNILVCTRQIWHENGIRGFYRGLPVHAAKDFTFAGFYLGLYGVLREALTTDGVVSSRGAFVSGALASSVTWTILLPLDTVKTMLQAKQPWQSVLQLRFVHLWRGLSPALLKAGPVSGLSSVAYEWSRRLCSA